MANGPKLEDYIQQGVYGAKELKPEERKKFLGTLRERIVLVLTESQVYEDIVYKEVEEEMKNHPNTNLLLNGTVPYNYLKKYIQIANKRNIAFRIVDNKGVDTDIGLVLAYENQAIDKEQIFVEKKKENDHAKPNNQNSSFKGIKGIFKKLFS